MMIDAVLGGAGDVGGPTSQKWARSGVAAEARESEGGGAEDVVDGGSSGPRQPPGPSAAAAAPPAAAPTGPSPSQPRSGSHGRLRQRRERRVGVSFKGGESGRQEEPNGGGSSNVGGGSSILSESGVGGSSPPSSEQASLGSVRSARSGGGGGGSTQGSLGTRGTNPRSLTAQSIGNLIWGAAVMRLDPGEMHMRRLLQAARGMPGACVPGPARRQIEWGCGVLGYRADLD